MQARKEYLKIRSRFYACCSEFSRENSFVEHDNKTKLDDTLINYMLKIRMDVRAHSLQYSNINRSMLAFL